jgi:hypothetical protein
MSSFWLKREFSASTVKPASRSEEQPPAQVEHLVLVSVITWPERYLMSRAMLVLTLLAASFVACSSERALHVEVPEIDVTDSATGVVPLPPGVPEPLSNVFVRYTKVVAPNGKPIHVFADAGWSEARIVKARKVLEHILTDAPGTRYGADKSAVANAMADNRATLVLFETEEALEEALAGPLGEVDLGMQDLRANECPIEGGDDYLAHATRDASYEEIIHLVHDYGIKPVLPEYHAELEEASDAATARGIWRGWPDDEPENHANEYLGVLYDNYLDLWWPNPTLYEGVPVADRGGVPPGQSHFGRYHVNSRTKLREVDPEGYELIEAFFQPHLTYAPALPEDFEGTFSIELDPELRYTSKSQHLDNVALVGSREAGLKGNDRANRLTGNSGDNVLEGGGGDDVLSGGAGVDTALFRGGRAEYEVVPLADGAVRVVDSDPDRDGHDHLQAMEVLQFADERVEL